MAQGCIALREETKSMGVMCSYKLREGIRVLGKVMVEKGYIPDEGLVFNMSMYEINQLIKARSPAIVQK
jgi:hypothetical protein